jgi:T4-like virus Myoviridae tail sheath stabiliser
MFGQIFYFSTIRKYVTLFGTLFDNIHVIRTDVNGNMTAFIKVPITYAPKEKMLARVQQDPNIDRPTATITLPTMSFEMTSVSYDPNRKLNTITRSAVVNPSDANSSNYQYNPVAYNFGFRLYILVKNAEDGTKIIEQILPYFTPDFTTTINLIPEMNVSMDIPLVLNHITQEDSYEGNFTERRSLTWTLDFTMKGYIYGPVKTGKIIKYTNTVFYIAQTANVADAVSNTDPVSYIQIRPGLDANGNPTSNASISVNTNLITANSDYGYIITKTDSDT